MRAPSSSERISQNPEAARSQTYPRKWSPVPNSTSSTPGTGFMLINVADKSGAMHDYTLVGDEEIVISGQGELAEGQTVKATPSDW